MTLIMCIKACFLVSGGVKGLTGNNVIYHPRYPQKMLVNRSQFTLVSWFEDPDVSLF